MKVSLGYLHQSIIKNNKEIADVIGEIRKHMENGGKDMVLMYAEHVGMLKQNNEELVATYHKMTEQYKKMIQISDAGKVAIKQAELKVSALEKHHAILTDSYNAMESAMSLIAGTPNPLARFYQTSDRVVRTMGEKMKDIEYFMLKSDEFVDDMDLQKGKYRKDGLELLENLANERLTDVFSTPVPSLPEEGVNLELTKEDENFFAEVEKLLKVKQTVEVPEAVE